MKLGPSRTWGGGGIHNNYEQLLSNVIVQGHVFIFESPCTFSERLDSSDSLENLINIEHLMDNCVFYRLCMYCEVFNRNGVNVIIFH